MALHYKQSSSLGGGVLGEGQTTPRRNVTQCLGIGGFLWTR